jgi:hypothetical protein
MVLMTLVRGGFPRWSRSNEVTNQREHARNIVTYRLQKKKNTIDAGQPSATLTFSPSISSQRQRKTKKQSSSWALLCTVHTR